MYRVLVFFVTSVAVLIDADDDIRKQCSTIDPGAMRCCTSSPAETQIISSDDAMECLEKRKPSPSCEADECLAKKLGYFEDDGKINMDLYTSLIDKRFEKDQVLLGKIKNNCFNVDLSKLGPPDMCDLRKRNRCVHKQVVENCTEWSNEGNCKGVKELIEMCLKD